jgi:hypothetical protein
MTQFPDPLSDVELNKQWYILKHVDSTLENNNTIRKIITPLLIKLQNTNTIDELFILNNKILNGVIGNSIYEALLTLLSLNMINTLDNMKKLQTIILINLIFKRIKLMIERYPIINSYIIYFSFYEKTDDIYLIQLTEVLTLPPKCLFDTDIPDTDIVIEKFNKHLFHKTFLNIRVDNNVYNIISLAIRYLMFIFITHGRGIEWLNTLPYIQTGDFECRLQSQLSMILVDQILDNKKIIDKNTIITINDIIDAILNYKDLSGKLYAAIIN